MGRETDLDLEFGFDASFYKGRYEDLSQMSDETALAHFLAHGHGERRYQSAIAGRELLLEQIPRGAPALEIGPFGAPQLHGARVRYADFLPTAELKARAPAHGFDPDRCPEIHYVLRDVALSDIAERFDAVFSSHCIEHQPDLIAHLQDVGRILNDGGAYFLVIPDKRFCFDHFGPASHLLDALTAHVEHRKLHSQQSVLASIAMATHNDVDRHWAGDHGSPPLFSNVSALLEAGRSEYVKSVATGVYLDVHAWRFVPRTFESVCSALYQLGLSPFRHVTACAPMHGRTEFCAILRKA